jgi:hypothetical protein
MVEQHTVYQPHITIERLPEAEREYGQLLNNLIRNLNYHVRAFAAALTLYEYATTESGNERTKELEKPTPPPGHAPYSEVLDSWRYVAARDGALTLYHFQRTFEGIKPALDRCPTVASLIDETSLVEGRRIFRRRFPHTVQIRKAVSHLADLASSVDGFDEHAFSGSYKGPVGGISFKNKQVIIVDLLQGNVFTTTFEKKILTYELSEESLEQLRLSGETIWNAFDAPTIKLTLNG